MIGAVHLSATGPLTTQGPKGFADDVELAAFDDVELAAFDDVELAAFDDAELAAFDELETLEGAEDLELAALEAEDPAGVVTNTDFAAEKFPAASPAETPYK